MGRKKVLKELRIRATISLVIGFISEYRKCIDANHTWVLSECKDGTEYG